MQATKVPETEEAPGMAGLEVWLDKDYFQLSVFN